MTFEQFTKWCYTFWFYDFIKSIGKRKQGDDTFLRKKSEEKQNSATIKISTD